MLASYQHHRQVDPYQSSRVNGDQEGPDYIHHPSLHYQGAQCDSRRLQYLLHHKSPEGPPKDGLPPYPEQGELHLNGVDGVGSYGRPGVQHSNKLFGDPSYFHPSQVGIFVLETPVMVDNGNKYRDK